MKSRRSSRRIINRRRERGSVIPIVVFSIILIVAFLGFTVDMMRAFLESQQLNFGLRSAALHIFPYACLDANGQTTNAAACTADGSINPDLLSRLSAELAKPNGDANNGSAWNQSTSNPESSDSKWLNDIKLDPSQISNGDSSDKQELCLRLTVRKQGADALHTIFLPMAYAAKTFLGQAIPQGVYSIEQRQSIEIVGQPACRIGPGAFSENSQGKAKDIADARLASFPLSLNYDDFKRALANTGTSANCTVHLCSPQASQYPASTELRGYFVNLTEGGSVNQYYNDAQSPARVDDLISTLLYFDTNQSQSVPQTVKAPSAVERGVQVDRFSSTAIQNNVDLATVVSQLRLNQCYIVPIVREAGISPSSQAEVLGFAWLKLSKTTVNGSSYDFHFSIGESLPVLNSSASTGLATIPKYDGSPLAALYDASNNPFKTRTFDISNNNFSARPKGIVLSPVVSPRIVPAN